MAIDILNIEPTVISRDLKGKGLINNCSYFFTNDITYYIEEEEVDEDVEEKEEKEKNEENKENEENPIKEISTKIILQTNKISKFNCSSKDIFYGQCEEINENKTFQ